MPEFGYGIGDFLIFLTPFAVLYVLKRVRIVDFSIGAAGAVFVGVLCLLSQRVSLRYGIHYDDTAAFGVGVLYIVGGTAYLIWERQSAQTQKKSGGKSEE